MEENEKEEIPAINPTAWSVVLDWASIEKQATKANREEKIKRCIAILQEDGKMCEDNVFPALLRAKEYKHAVLRKYRVLEPAEHLCSVLSKSGFTTIIVSE